jgi:hypothetical protein
MNTRYFARALFIALFLSLIPASGFTQAQPAQEYKPEVGQEGKDVVWVPTPQALVDKMLDLAKVTPKDYVIDLGSGDGRTVITAAKRGAKAHGIEYNPDMVELSNVTPPRKASRQSHFCQGRSVRKRLLAGPGDYHVSPIEHQHETAPEDPRFETRHAHRFEYLRHGRMETRRDRQGQWLRKLVHRPSVDRAGESGRDVEAAARRA